MRKVLVLISTMENFLDIHGGNVFCTVSDFEGFPGKFIFENVGNKSAKD